MIKLYEVCFELENSSRLYVLMVAGSADEAKKSAHDTLCAAAEPRNVGDAIQYNWRFGEITARVVEINTPIPA